MILVAGPCSAESLEQVRRIATALSQAGITHFRAGVWKPRTRPGTFEGRGEEALLWLAEIQRELGLSVAVEVGTPWHTSMALKHGITTFWIGARTSTSPFMVEEIARSVAGEHVRILVKNPISPEINLWIGAIERVASCIGEENVLAVHRGFATPYSPYPYRYAPVWEIPLELRIRMRNIPLLCDPSHIAGSRELVRQVCVEAMLLGYDGLMVEVHDRPEEALTDGNQQITPWELRELLVHLRRFRYEDELTDENQKVKATLSSLRSYIDQVDRQLLELIALRISVVERLAKLKHHNQLAVFQPGRWRELLSERLAVARRLGLPQQAVKELFSLLHSMMVSLQVETLRDEEQNPQQE